MKGARHAGRDRLLGLGERGAPRRLRRGGAPARRSARASATGPRAPVVRRRRRADRRITAWRSLSHRARRKKAGGGAGRLILDVDLAVRSCRKNSSTAASMVCAETSAASTRRVRVPEWGNGRREQNAAVSPRLTRRIARRPANDARQSRRESSSSSSLLPARRMTIWSSSIVIWTGRCRPSARRTRSSCTAGSSPSRSPPRHG